MDQISSKILFQLFIFIDFVRIWKKSIFGGGKRKENLFWQKNKYNCSNMILQKLRILTKQMENAPDLKLPNHLCQQIFNNEFEIDIGNLSEQIVAETVQLYVEAMQYFSNLMSLYSDNPEVDLALIQRKQNFYQQKIKKLLSRHEVDDCLIGKKTDKKTLEFSKQLTKIHEQAPQQAKVLIQHFKHHQQNQENLIHNSITKQEEKLNERIRRRSLSVKKPLNKTKAKQAQKVQKIYRALGEKLLFCI